MDVGWLFNPAEKPVEQIESRCRWHACSRCNLHFSTFYHFICIYTYMYKCITYIMYIYIYCIEKSFCVCRLSQDISRCIAFSNIIFEFNFVTHFSTFYNYITSHKFFSVCRLSQYGTGTSAPNVLHSKTQSSSKTYHITLQSANVTMHLFIKTIQCETQSTLFAVQAHLLNISLFSDCKIAPVFNVIHLST